jgi:hypothetical protein
VSSIGPSIFLASRTRTIHRSSQMRPTKKSPSIMLLKNGGCHRGAVPEERRATAHGDASAPRMSCTQAHLPAARSQFSPDGRLCSERRLASSLRPAHIANRRLRRLPLLVLRPQAAAAYSRSPGITSSTSRLQDSRSHAAFGPAQSTVLSSRQPNGPTCRCRAINLVSTVLDEP